MGIGPGPDRVPDALVILRGQPWSLFLTVDFTLQSPFDGLHPRLPFSCCGPGFLSQPPEYDTTLAKMSTYFLIFIVYGVHLCHGWSMEVADNFWESILFQSVAQGLELGLSGLAAPSRAKPPGLSNLHSVR